MNTTDRQRRRTCAGFTLVELLVVIGVIALLIGVAFPVLKPALSKSKRVVCLSNLRQLGVGFQAYRDDHGGAVPICQTLPVDPARPALNTVLADDGFEGGKAWRCPSDAELHKSIGVSYEYFLGMMGMMADSPKDLGKLVSDMDRGQGQMPVLIDADGWHPGGPNQVDRNAYYFDGRVDWLGAE